jgi:hypothetical protein
MPATITSEPRFLAHHPPRPWRQVESQPVQRRPAAEHRFAAPVVRELPPRRERLALVATW